MSDQADRGAPGDAGRGRSSHVGGGAGAYAHCLQFFAELKALGVTRAVVSPGSRSTPLALCARAAGLAITVQIDERVAAFHALGHAKVTGLPAVLICTSGTAGANYLPAVIEADHGGTPMIVCTADRPPELRRWGAGQTIDQLHLYGPHVRWFQELPVGGDADKRLAPATALRAVVTSVHQEGPVHLNWPFREPLEPSGELDVPTTASSVLPARPAAAPSAVLASVAARAERGIIVAGPARWSERACREVVAFASRWGWPILADPASGFRAQAGPVVTTAELLLATPAFVSSLPDAEIVVAIGGSLTSKAYRLWLEGNPPPRAVLVAPGTDWAAPTGVLTDVIPGPVDGLFGDVAGPARSTTWTDSWRRADEEAGRVVAAELESDNSELAATRSLLDALGASDEPACLVVSNSMPIRDLDVVMHAAGARVDVVANRGANGIDGVIATGAGIAEASGRPTVLLVGDVAAVHDIGGLAAAARLDLDNLTVVLIDNDGGGIFAFLPIADRIDQASFSELFLTPHGTDLAAVGAALGYEVVDVARANAVGQAAVASPRHGPRLVRFQTTAAATVTAMAGLRAGVARALEQPGS